MIQSVSSRVPDNRRNRPGGRTAPSPVRDTAASAGFTTAAGWHALGSGDNGLSAARMGRKRVTRRPQLFCYYCESSSPLRVVVFGGTSRPNNEVGWMQRRRRFLVLVLLVTMLVVGACGTASTTSSGTPLEVAQAMSLIGRP